VTLAWRFERSQHCDPLATFPAPDRQSPEHLAQIKFKLTLPP
jgi:hypothetical protein